MGIVSYISTTITISICNLFIYPLAHWSFLNRWTHSSIFHKIINSRFSNSTKVQKRKCPNSFLPLFAIFEIITYSLPCCCCNVVWLLRSWLRKFVPEAIAFAIRIYVSQVNHDKEEGKGETNSEIPKHHYSLELTSLRLIYRWQAFDLFMITQYHTHITSIQS